MSERTEFRTVIEAMLNRLTWFGKIEMHMFMNSHAPTHPLAPSLQREGETSCS